MKLNSAVIGLGRIGCGFDDIDDGKIKTHAGAYFKNPNTKLIAFCDVDNSKLKKYGKKYHVENLFSNYKELFKKTNLDVISISTHADLHLPIIQEASKYNIKGIFLEKPISNNLVDAKKIIKICNTKNIKLQIDHQRRFSKFYHDLQNFISKKLGNLKFCNVIYGAGILNTGTHVIDIVRFFLGDIYEVNGYASNFKLRYTNDFNIDAKIRFKNGCLCELHALDYSKYRILELDIIGDNGRIVLDLAKNTAISFLPNSKQNLVYGELEKKEINRKKEQEFIQSGLDNLIKSIKTHKELFCTGLDGYKSLEGALGLIMSMKNKNKTLRYPLRATRLIF